MSGEGAKPIQPSAPLPDDSSEDEEISEQLKTTEAERRGTIPRSPYADAIALLAQRAQTNPTVPRGKGPKPTKQPKTGDQGQCSSDTKPKLRLKRRDKKV